jgi:biotin carboxyl carrier protein
MAKEDDELAMAAAAGVGGHGANLWARHAREDLQASHSLTAPLARWIPEPEDSPLLAVQPPREAVPGEPDTDIVIPESVLRARPPLRLPEDAFCRSPIAGLVIAVMSVAGEPVTRHRPVMVIEAMKMQNNVAPEADGVLKALHVAPGDSVKAGQVLFELE